MPCLRYIFLVTCAFYAANAQIVNPGTCPAVNNPPGPCVQLCTDDSRCGRGFKCCDTGCGRVCRTVLGDQGSPPPQQQQQQQQQRGNSPRPPLPPNRQGGPPQPGAAGGRAFPIGQSPQNGNRQPQNQQQQRHLEPQPSLVGLGGCSRGATLRNADGSTLVCGFGVRDFACPAGFSCTFDNFLRALICCPTDDITPPPTPSPPENPCQAGEPIKDEFGNRLQCNAAGVPANACPAGTLCVSSFCCPVSVQGFLSVKPGICPAPQPVSQGAACQNECNFDADCLGAGKCCFVGCGFRCIDVSVGPPGSNAGGAPGDNGQQLQPSQGDLVPTRNDGIFIQQPRSQFFNGPNGFQPRQNGNQQGFLNNGLPPRGPQNDQQQQQFGNRGPQQNFGQVQRPQQQQQQFRGPQPQQFAGPQQPFGARPQRDFPSKDEEINPKSKVKPAFLPVTANDTCDTIRCPACHQCSEETGIPRCVRMFECCPDGSAPTACDEDPCKNKKVCPDNSDAFCIPDSCGTCRAAFYDRNGSSAPCPTYDI